MIIGVAIGSFNLNRVLNSGIKGHKHKVLYLLPSPVITHVTRHEGKSMQFELLFICWNFNLSIHYV